MLECGLVLLQYPVPFPQLCANCQVGMRQIRELKWFSFLFYKSKSYMVVEQMCMQLT